jgi:2,4-didehydro-3-deoxy-L-rhamnonate hydrolase
MRFVTFVNDAADSVAGIVLGHAGSDLSRIVDLSHPAYRHLLDGTQPALPVFVEQGLDMWAERLQVIAERPDPESTRTMSTTRLRAPLPRPGKIVGAAFNFRDGLAERGAPEPAEPITFVRSGSTVVGPGEPILLPPDVGNITYEAELAVVIGRLALSISPAQAMRHVAGYTIHNDVSGSDLVKTDGGNFVRGKNLPASAPLGPWLATVDEVPDPYRIGIRLDVDGRLLQDGSTASMLFGIAELISWISHRMPLEPGDVIATGTPAGVAAMHEPPAWLTPGSTVTIELQGLGRLVNPLLAGGVFL